VIVTLPAGESALAGQLLQLAFPRVVLYDPATHTVHVPPAKPEDPELHVQAVRVMLPAGESEFTGQLLQGVSPDTALYNPRAHMEHVALSGPENPAGHCTEHSVDDVLPGLEVVPDGHKEQVTSPFGFECARCARCARASCGSDVASVARARCRGNTLRR